VWWPLLLNVETGMNGDSKSTNERGPSLVGSFGLSCRYKRFVFSLASLVSPVQNIFFLTFIFPPSPSNLGRQPGWFTCVLVCVSEFNASEIFLKGTMGAACVGLFYCFNTLRCRVFGDEKNNGKERNAAYPFQTVSPIHFISSVFFYIFDINFISAEYKIVTAILEQ
jgi:hypothetical protein